MRCLVGLYCSAFEATSYSSIASAISQQTGSPTEGLILYEFIKPTTDILISGETYCIVSRDSSVLNIEKYAKLLLRHRDLFANVSLQDTSSFHFANVAYQLDELLTSFSVRVNTLLRVLDTSMRQLDLVKKLIVDQTSRNLDTYSSTSFYPIIGRLTVESPFAQENRSANVEVVMRVRNKDSFQYAALSDRVSSFKARVAEISAPLP